MTDGHRRGSTVPGTERSHVRSRTCCPLVPRSPSTRLQLCSVNYTSCTFGSELCAEEPYPIPYTFTDFAHGLRARPAPRAAGGGAPTLRGRAGGRAEPEAGRPAPPSISVRSAIVPRHDSVACRAMPGAGAGRLGRVGRRRTPASRARGARTTPGGAHVPFSFLFLFKRHSSVVEQ